MQQGNNIEDQVRRILANLDNEQGNQEPHPDIPESEQAPKAPDTLQDIYVFIVKEGKPEPAEQIIDSTCSSTEADPFTYLDGEPEIQAILEEDAQKPLIGESVNNRLVKLTVSFALFVFLACILLQIHLILNPPTVTVIILPKSQQVILSGTLQLGRVVSPITLSQSTTAPTTGKGHQDAKQAQGTLTFYNGQLSPQTVPAGTILTGTDGMQIVTDQDATIPAADPAANPPIFGQVTVSARAVNPGVRGNIPAYDISQPCCFASVIAKNTQAFHGGQDERNYQTVTQADINGGAVTLKTTLAQSMQGALAGQVKNGEALVAPTCTPQVSADHQVGEEATQVKVTVSERCSAVAYNQTTLLARATDLLTTQATKQLSTGYSLIGTVQVSISRVTVTRTTAPLVFLSFSAQGTWVYALSDAAQEHIKSLIKGHTKQDALHILAALPGIESASMQWGDDTKLPKDPKNIHVVLIYGIEGNGKL